MSYNQEKDGHLYRGVHWVTTMGKGTLQPKRWKLGLGELMEMGDGEKE